VKVRIRDGVQQVYDTDSEFADGTMAEDCDELKHTVGDFVLGREIHGTPGGSFSEGAAFEPTGISKTRKNRFRSLKSIDEIIQQAIPLPQDHLQTTQTAPSTSAPRELSYTAFAAPPGGTPTGGVHTGAVTAGLPGGLAVLLFKTFPVVATGWTVGVIPADSADPALLIVGEVISFAVLPTGAISIMIQQPELTKEA
jgi:hypothetical protein